MRDVLSMCGLVGVHALSHSDSSLLFLKTFYAHQSFSSFMIFEQTRSVLYASHLKRECFLASGHGKMTLRAVLNQMSTSPAPDWCCDTVAFWNSCSSD